MDRTSELRLSFGEEDVKRGQLHAEGAYEHFRGLANGSVSDDLCYCDSGSVLA